MSSVDPHKDIADEDPRSSYWTWAILLSLVAFNQLLGVSEKFWIKVGMHGCYHILRF